MKNNNNNDNRHIKIKPVGVCCPHNGLHAINDHLRLLRVCMPFRFVFGTVCSLTAGEATGITLPTKTQSCWLVSTLSDPYRPPSANLPIDRAPLRRTLRQQGCSSSCSRPHTGETNTLQKQKKTAPFAANTASVCLGAVEGKRINHSTAKVQFSPC